MIKFMKKNKIFTLLVLVTIITFTLGLLIYALINDDVKLTISNNITNLISNMENINNNNFTLFRKTLFSNFFIIILIWVFGISIIGIFIVLFIYLYKVFILGVEFISLFMNLGVKNILFTCTYLLIQFANIFVIFILSYYAISFSVFLSRSLFDRENINLKSLMKRYLSILIISIILCIISSLIEVFVIPRVIVLFK